MTIQLSDKEVKEARRLGKHLAVGIIPVNDVKKFLDGIGRQIDNPVARPSRKVNESKMSRKDKYRSKLFTP